MYDGRDLGWELSLLTLVAVGGTKLNEDPKEQMSAAISQFLTCFPISCPWDVASGGAALTTVAL